LTAALLEAHPEHTREWCLQSERLETTIFYNLARFKYNTRRFSIKAGDTGDYRLHSKVCKVPIYGWCTAVHCNL